MNRLFKWIESKTSQMPTDGQHSPVEDLATENNQEENGDCDHTSTVPTLTTIKETSFEVVESDGFDPYNSGSFESSKSRLRKNTRS
jgi:hypothetical protein